MSSQKLNFAQEVLQDRTNLEISYRKVAQEIDLSGINAKKQAVADWPKNSSQLGTFTSSFDKSFDQVMNNPASARKLLASSKSQLAIGKKQSNFGLKKLSLSGLPSMAYGQSQPK